MNCPKCGHILDAAMSVDPTHRDVPKEGDVSICIECSNVMVFDGDPAMPRIPTAEEQYEILQDPEVMQGLIALTLAKRKTLQ